MKPSLKVFKETGYNLSGEVQDLIRSLDRLGDISNEENDAEIEHLNDEKQRLETTVQSLKIENDELKEKVRKLEREIDLMNPAFE